MVPLQQTNYDCGHCCLEYLGLPRPTVKKPLTGEYLYKSLGKMVDYDADDLPIKYDGIYLLEGPTSHWIVKRGKVIFDPVRGEITKRAFNKWYKNYVTSYGIVLKGES